MKKTLGLGDMGMYVEAESNESREEVVKIRNIEEYGSYLVVKRYLSEPRGTIRVRENEDVFFPNNFLDYLKRNLFLVRYTSLLQEARWISGSNRMLDSGGNETTPIIHYARKECVIELIDSLLALIEKAITRDEGLWFRGEFEVSITRARLESDGS